MACYASTTGFCPPGTTYYPPSSSAIPGPVCCPPGDVPPVMTQDVGGWWDKFGTTEKLLVVGVGVIAATAVAKLVWPRKKYHDNRSRRRRRKVRRGS